MDRSRWPESLNLRELRLFLQDSQVKFAVLIAILVLSGCVPVSATRLVETQTSAPTAALAATAALTLESDPSTERTLAASASPAPSELPDLKFILSPAEVAQINLEILKLQSSPNQAVFFKQIGADLVSGGYNQEKILNAASINNIAIVLAWLTLAQEAGWDINSHILVGQDPAMGEKTLAEILEQVIIKHDPYCKNLLLGHGKYLKVMAELQKLGISQTNIGTNTTTAADAARSLELALQYDFFREVFKKDSEINRQFIEYQGQGSYYGIVGSDYENHVASTLGVVVVGDGGSYIIVSLGGYQAAEDMALANKLDFLQTTFNKIVANFQ